MSGDIFCTIHIHEYLQLPARPATPIKPVSPKEMKAKIGRLHLKKAPDMDLITPTMLKELPHEGIILLTYSMPYSGINIGLTHLN
jgi:hypothetical protein